MFFHMCITTQTQHNKVADSSLYVLCFIPWFQFHYDLNNQQTDIINQRTDLNFNDTCKATRNTYNLDLDIGRKI